jgi:Na/Pi-cotransporter
MNQPFLALLTGLGLIFFSLRHLVQSFEPGLARRLLPALTRLTQKKISALFCGIGITLIVQASSITLFLAMGLLSRRWITLPTALLLMLGATIGSALKIFFLQSVLTYLVPLLLFSSSLLSFFTRSRWKKGLGEIGLAVGMACLGIEIIARGFSPVFENPEVQQILLRLDGPGLLSTLSAFLIGLAAATLFQSSSTVIALLLTWGVANAFTTFFIPFLAAMILGANLGTTSTGLLGSLGQGRDAKRLALGHFAVKFSGSLIVLLFLHTHLSALDFILSQFTSAPSLSARIATFHLSFNILNALTWTFLLPFLVRGLHFLLRTPHLASNEAGALSQDLQPLFRALPERAVQELLRALLEQLRNVHWVHEGVFHFLFHEGQKAKDQAFLELLQGKVTTATTQLEGIEVALLRLGQESHLNHSRACLSEMTRLLTQLQLASEAVSGVLQQLHKEFQIAAGQLPQFKDEASLAQLKELRLRLNVAWDEIFHSILALSKEPQTEDSKPCSPTTKPQGLTQAILNHRLEALGRQLRATEKR